MLAVCRLGAIAVPVVLFEHYWWYEKFYLSLMYQHL
jgi:hypothetical protein